MSDDQVSVFAITTISGLGRRNPARFYDYENVVRTDTGWSVSFAVSEHPDWSESHRGNFTDAGQVTLIIESIGPDRLSIAEVAGNATSYERSMLEGRSAMASRPASDFVFRFEDQSSTEEGSSVLLSLYWVGEIPTPLRGACSVEVINDAGEVVWTDKFTKSAPIVEGARDGLAAVEVPDSVTDIGSARASCSDWTTYEVPDPAE